MKKIKVILFVIVIMAFRKFYCTESINVSEIENNNNLNEMILKLNKYTMNTNLSEISHDLLSGNKVDLNDVNTSILKSRFKLF